ncbi:MAG: type II secretion system F family protein [Halocynthiibacter sp.]
MDIIKEILISQLGPSGPLIATLLIGVFIILIVVLVVFPSQDDPIEKLKKNKHNTPSDVSENTQLRQNSEADRLARFSTFLEPQDEQEFSETKMKLIRAGYRNPNAVRIFHMSQVALGLGGLVLGLGYALLLQTTGAVPLSKMMMFTVIPGAAGYYIPKYMVTRNTEERKKKIIEGFPDALDMLLICVEAGQSLDQAIRRVSVEIQAGFPELAEELSIVAHEMKAGKDKGEVLKDLGHRTDIQDIQSFVTVLVQSQKFGTSIADALRVYAGEMRDKRVMRAEEKANTLPTKMTLATMFFTLPPLLIILIGPSIYDIAQSLGNLDF